MQKLSNLGKTQAKRVFCYCNANKSKRMQMLSNRSMKLLKGAFKHFFIMTAVI